MTRFLRDCFGSRYLILLAAGALLVGLGLLAWGVAPKLVLGALPLLGLAACLAPCLLPIWWLRRQARDTAVPAAPEISDPNALTRS